MNPKSAIARILFALCALGIFASQVFGVTRGYVCDCSGKPVEVRESGCSGPHGANCHSSSAEAKHDHKGDGGEHKEHKAIKGQIESCTLPVQAAAPASPLVAILPALIFMLPEPVEVWPEAFSDQLGLPPPGIALERSVVLLI